MKNQREIVAGAIISIVGFVVAILVAIVVVQSDIPSKASNDGWLGFMGGLFGSFISGIITFFILFINRKDMLDGETKKQKVAEMDKMEEYLKEAFAIVRVDGSNAVATTNFMLIQSKINSEFHKTKFFEMIELNIVDCQCGRAPGVMIRECDTYAAFIEYKKRYIEEK